MDRQKVFNEVMKPLQGKVFEIMKKHNIKMSDMFKLNKEFGKDKEVQKYIWEMAKYVAF